MLCLSTFGQIPDSLFLKADSVLSSVGDTNKLLQYNCALSYANYGSSRWYMCGEGDPDYSPRVKWEDYKDFIEFKIAFDLNQNGLLKDFAYIKFDRNGNYQTYSHSMMPELVAQYSNIKISEKKAYEIAFEAGLEWQNKELKIELVDDSDYGKDYHFYWQVRNHQIHTPECERNGQIVIIDAETGEIVKNTEWNVECIE